MDGGEALVRTLAAGGVEICFANPGTSELHVVAALDRVPTVRGVLTLFEGVATGAADGYARMAEKPGATLLHLGPGLANGIANLHNARRARSPVVNLVGDHATTHTDLDAPLQSDIEALAGAVPGWYRRPDRVGDVCRAAAEAVSAATGPPGRVATLVLPADVSWSEGASPITPLAPRSPVPPDAVAVAEAAEALLGGEPAAVLLGGSALRAGATRSAAAVSAATGSMLLSETFPARVERGGGVPDVPRLAYHPERAAAQLDGVCHLVLLGAASPVSFFATPGRPGDLVPEGCRVHDLAVGGVDPQAAVEALAGELGARGHPGAASTRPVPPSGALDPASVAAAVGAALPEGAIVVDEANTASLRLLRATRGAGIHDWLGLTGGAIGMGMPAAAGAAIACPDRPVWCLEADGSAMYTPQALWTQAREGLAVTTVVISNRAYAILRLEYERAGLGVPGDVARSMLDIGAPALDFVELARAMGVPASRATTGEELVAALEHGRSGDGPYLVEAVVGGRF